MTEMEVVPRDLWVVGNNGRIDVRRGDDYFVMKDVAEQFEPPDWRISASWDRTNFSAFDEGCLRNLLG